MCESPGHRIVEHQPELGGDGVWDGRFGDAIEVVRAASEVTRQIRPFQLYERP